MPHGMSTPRINVIRCTEVSEFCIDRSVKFFSVGDGILLDTALLDEIISDSNNSNICKRAAVSGTMVLNVEL